jgi:aspartyl-tRNA(Asn)/glutamyl-tRNA(Gln) amidotransferase subunit A
MTFSRRKFTYMAAALAGMQALRVRAGGLATTQSQPADSGVELTSLSIAEAAAKLRKREVTSLELTDACLARIAAYNSKIDAYITVTGEQARAQAKQMDAELKAGKSRSPLHGIPIGLKDNIDTAGVRTTGGSALYADRVPDTDAPVAAKLREAGAVLLGKLNMHEFALGAGETSYFGPARNPWALDRNTGGSSSGSGAALSAELCYGALGTDTGGSVRFPATFCSVVGLKVTYGLVPIRGIMPLTLSLDSCGPMARTVEDTAILLNHMTGYDNLDITSVRHDPEDYVAAMKQPVSAFPVGMPYGCYDRLDPEVRTNVMAAIDVIRKLVKEVKDVSLPSVGDAALIGPYAETYAWHKETFDAQPGKYMLHTRRAIEANSKMDATTYIRAHWQLERLRRTVDEAFVNCDLVVLPTMNILPPKLQEMLDADAHPAPHDPQSYGNASLFNLYGTPAISIPCGFSSGGLPIGLCISGPHFSEGRILALAHAYESATEWHKRRPPLHPDTPVPVLVESI